MFKASVNVQFLIVFFLFFQFVWSVEAGRALETEMNAAGPGEAIFVQCDVTKEEQIKVM